VLKGLTRLGKRKGVKFGGGQAVPSLDWQSQHRPVPLSEATQACPLVRGNTGLSSCQSQHRPVLLSEATQACPLVRGNTGLSPCQRQHRPVLLSEATQACPLVRKSYLPDSSKNLAPEGTWHQNWQSVLLWLWLWLVKQSSSRDARSHWAWNLRSLRCWEWYQVMISERNLGTLAYAILKWLQLFDLPTRFLA
jgi:hypothetical protein